MARAGGKTHIFEEVSERAPRKDLNRRCVDSPVNEQTPGSFDILLRVIGCVDSRVDPSHVLGLELGEAVVMRNIGGRITPAVLRSWALLAKIGQARPSGRPGDGPPHMVILHHTDCGIKTLANYPELLAKFFEIPVEELDTRAVKDPHAAVRIDVDIVRRTMPAGFLVSGLVYDTDTGLVEVVVSPATA